MYIQYLQSFNRRIFFMRKVSYEERLIQELNKIKALRRRLSKLVADIEYLSMMTDVNLDLSDTDQEELDNE